MILKRLQKKKRITVLGLNSGTSADGLDLAAIEIDRSRRHYRVRFLAGRTGRYPAELRRMILTLADSELVSAEDLIRVDQALGLFFGRTAAAFIRHLLKQDIRIDAVASHGQTIRHLPQLEKMAGYVVRGSLQLGNLDRISSLTDKLVIGDFRQADIALGGEGAPITVAAMERLFGVPDESRLIVNLGGIANFFFFPARRSRLAAAASDCGPGNSLSDLLSQRLFGELFDRGGARAMKGQVCQRLLSLLGREPFFDHKTASTGREAFGASLAGRIIDYGKKLRLSKADMLATTAEVTVASIADSVQTFVNRDPHLHKLYLTGGGVRNRFFRQRLQELLGGLEVDSIASLGYNPDLVEASAYAVMGEACLRSEALPTRFGRAARQKRWPVLGRIVQPPQKG